MPCPFRCSIVDTKYAPPKPLFYWWGKAQPCYPKHHIKLERCPQKPFKPSFDSPNCEPCMKFLLSNEYSRIYENELCEYKNQIKQEQLQVLKKKKASVQVKPKKIPASDVPTRFIMKKFENIPSKIDSKGFNPRQHKKQYPPCIPQPIHCQKPCSQCICCCNC